MNLTIPILPELQTITDATKTDHLVFPATQTMKPFTSNDFGKAALLGDLISVLLTPYDDSAAFSGRIRVAVPRMGVGEGTANILALIVHELATNSVKHGALSVEAGSLDISSTSDEEEVHVIWAETGGPLVEAPAAMNGYGSRMVARSVVSQLQGAISYDWQPSALVVTLRMKKARLSS